MNAEGQAGIGLIGCGNISGIYLESPKKFPNLCFVACADLDPARAQSRAAEYGVPLASTVDELLANPEVDVVLNLTIPAAHASVARAAIAAGKHVYNEKPLALERAQGRALLEEAAAKGLRVGCAPDTFLGSGLQTCRSIFDSGMIGEPVAAAAFFMGHGPEGWHPDPETFYQIGAGPLLDVGPYYVTALISLLGPVARVGGMARISFPQREIGSEPKKGQMITVNTPTHITGSLEFASGQIATLITSFDVWSSEVPRLEIYGSKGTLSVPDPNTFGGPVKVRLQGEDAWHEVELVSPYTANNRGLGLSDMVSAIYHGTPHRASGEMAFHALDVMYGVLEGAAEGRTMALSSSCERPAALEKGAVVGALD